MRINKFCLNKNKPLKNGSGIFRQGCRKQMRNLEIVDYKTKNYSLRTKSWLSQKLLFWKTEVKKQLSWKSNVKILNKAWRCLKINLQPKKSKLSKQIPCTSTKNKGDKFLRTLVFHNLIVRYMPSFRIMWRNRCKDYKLWSPRMLS